MDAYGWTYCLRTRQPDRRSIDGALLNHPEINVPRRCRKFALAMSVLTVTQIAAAFQAPAPVVLVQYVVAGTSPDKMESSVADPLERTLRTLPRLSAMSADIRDVAGGVATEIRLDFQGGATPRDVATVLSYLARHDSENSMASAISVRLAPARTAP